MGIVILFVAVVGFVFGAFWCAGLTWVMMREKKYPWYASLPTAAVAGTLGDAIVGALLGFGIAWIALR